MMVTCSQVLKSHIVACNLAELCVHLVVMMVSYSKCSNASQWHASIGAAGGTSLNSASVACKGPGVPVPLTGSNALAAYSGNFVGVNFTPDTDPDGTCSARGS